MGVIFLSKHPHRSRFSDLTRAVQQQRLSRRAIFPQPKLLYYFSLKHFLFFIFIMQRYTNFSILATFCNLFRDIFTTFCNLFMGRIATFCSLFRGRIATFCFISEGECARFCEGRLKVADGLTVFCLYFCYLSTCRCPATILFGQQKRFENPAQTEVNEQDKNIFCPRRKMFVSLQN